MNLGQGSMILTEPIKFYSWVRGGLLLLFLHEISLKYHHVLMHHSVKSAIRVLSRISCGLRRAAARMLPMFATQTSR